MVREEYDRLRNLYDTHEKQVIINQGDPDLVEIKIDILELIQQTHKLYGRKPPNDYPATTLIANYGMEPKNQVFKRIETPEKLIELEDDLRATIKKKKNESFTKVEQRVINAFWETLEDNKTEYWDEIMWIDRMWYYRLFGYWFYNNGKPYYMTGDNFFFLHCWNLENYGAPDYRDRDRRWFIFQQYAKTDTKTFAKLDKNNRAIPEEDGSYQMIDTGSRVCHGTSDSKARRAGDTSKGSSMNLNSGTMYMEVHNGIQGKDDDNARNVFNNHIVFGLRKSPIYFRPLMAKLDPSDALHFTYEDPDLELNSRIDFATSADRSAYDGYALGFYHADEPGKVKNESVSDRHEVAKLCCSRGDEITGFMIYTTTVDEMNRRGGEEFLRLSKNSLWNERDGNGRTRSGLYVGFFRASDGRQGFLDKYGMSVEETPTPEQARQIGKNYGAREQLERRRRALVKRKAWDDLSLEKRQNPQRYRECFTPPAKSTFFRNDILEGRIEELEFDLNLVRRGELYWINGRFGDVGWRDDEEGRFEISIEWPKKYKNRWIIEEGTRRPEFLDLGVIGADAFRLEKTEGSRMSKGGIAGFYKRNETADPMDKPLRDWVSNRFVLYYNYRQDTTDEYAEDVALAAIFFGFMVYPEMNVDVVDKKFREWGLEGYLLHDYDANKDEFKVNPGCTTLAKVKLEIFNLWRDHIKVHGKRERHANLLTQCLQIPSYDAMTDFDGFTAGGVALKGAQSNYAQAMEQGQDETNVSDWFTQRQY